MENYCYDNKDIYSNIFFNFFDIYTDDNKSAVDESVGLLKTDSYVGSDGGRYGGKPSAISTTISRPPFVTNSETSWLAMGK